VGKKTISATNELHMLARYENVSIPGIGATEFCAHQDPPDELPMPADLAMHESKTASRNTRRFFESRMKVLLERETV
jgi:hypothetical protein